MEIVRPKGGRKGENMANEKVKADDLLKYTAETLHDIGIYINADQSDTQVPMGQVKSFSLNIPEDGCYVVTASNEWNIDSESSFSVLYLEYNGEIVAFSRNDLRAGGGQSVTAIIQATKGSSVQAKMSWHGGSGNCTAQKITFRAVRVGGGQ